MVQSKAATVAEYLAELPEERRKVVSTVRKLVNDNIPKGYKEGVSSGMITWDVPLSRSGPTYNKQPLGYAGLAAQKNSYSLYLMGLYVDPKIDKRFRDAYRKSGRKLDCGKCCVRFKNLEQLDVEAVADVLRAIEVEEFVTAYSKVHPPPK